jgi:hypothetical protein
MFLVALVRGLCLFTLTVLFCSLMTSAQEYRPLKSHAGAGERAIRNKTPGGGCLLSVALTGHDDARLERAGQRFLSHLGRQTGHLAIPTNAGSDTSLRERSCWMKTAGKIRPNQSYYKLHEIQALGEHSLQYGLTLRAQTE